MLLIQDIYIVLFKSLMNIKTKSDLTFFLNLFYMLDPIAFFLIPDEMECVLMTCE